MRWLLFWSMLSYHRSIHSLLQLCPRAMEPLVSLYTACGTAFQSMQLSNAAGSSIVTSSAQF